MYIILMNTSDRGLICFNIGKFGGLVEDSQPFCFDTLQEAEDFKNKLPIIYDYRIFKEV